MSRGVWWDYSERDAMRVITILVARLGGDVTIERKAVECLGSEIRVDDGPDGIHFRVTNASEETK